MLPIFGKQNSLLLLGPIMLSLYTLNQDLFLCAENLKNNRLPCKFEMDCNFKKWINVCHPDIATLTYSSLPLY